MALELNPTQAGDAAVSAYALRLSANMIDAATGADSVRGDFNIVNGQRLTGVTGAGPVSRGTGFGYIAFGSPGGRQGECLVSIRGTEPSSGHDWLTNLRMAGVSGPTGYTVHAGFWNLASGLLPQIKEALKGRNPSLIHVVGHSLGGATATLVAESIQNSGIAGVKLYTYGAPRAGVEYHAAALTQRIGRANIYRVYHHTDPVPMVPVFPYAHVPFEDDACLLRGGGTLISADAHLMPNYLASVEGRGWEDLRKPQMPKLDTFEAADRWLAVVASGQGISIMLSAVALRMILWALKWVLRKAGEVMGYALLGGATIIDYLAKLLYRGVLQSVEVGRSVANLIGAIMRFTGRVLDAGQKITEAFIQYVLELLYRMVASAAAQAISRLP